MKPWEKTSDIHVVVWESKVDGKHCRVEYYNERGLVSCKWSATYKGWSKSGDTTSIAIGKRKATEAAGELEALVKTCVLPHGN